jgi:hypothetical protein
MKRQRPRMFLPKIHPPKFARNGETCDAKVAYPRFSRSPIFAPFRADPKCDPERRARAGWHVRAAGERWQTHPLCKKFTLSRNVTGAPATARSKVNKRGSMLKLGLEIHREKFVVVAQYERATPHRSVLLPRNLSPWVEARMREGFEVHVVYESFGFGYALYRVAASWRAPMPGHSGSWVIRFQCWSALASCPAY